MGSGGTAGFGTFGGTAGDSASGGTAGSLTSGGTAGTSGTPGTETRCLIETDDEGWVSNDTNDCGIQGYWYSYSDCTTSPDDCTLNLLPGEGLPFVPDGILMCTSATTAEILSTDELEAKWGAGIGVSLNQPPGGEPREPIGGLPVHLLGFAFDVVGTLIPEELRVNFPTPNTQRVEHFMTITSMAGHYEVRFSDELEQGSWVENPTSLDPAAITAIQFHVPTQEGTQITFDYCIGNLYGLYTE